MPKPPGEEQLDSWINQAQLMIQEGVWSTRQRKRMRIMESVKGPTLEILHAVQFNNPHSTPEEYISGTPETGKELDSLLE